MGSGELGVEWARTRKRAKRWRPRVVDIDEGGVGTR